MAIRDFNIDWLESRIFIPATNFTGLAQAQAAPGALRTYESATALTAQVASALVAKIALGAAGDGAATLIMVPYDLDIKKVVRFRVWYTQTATSGTVTWNVTYALLSATQAGTAGATVIAAPATALNTVVPAASGTVVANDLRVTDFGVITRNTIPDTTDAISIEVKSADGSGVAGTGLLGLEIRYTPRRAAGPRRNILGGRRLVTNRPLGVQLATAQEGL